MTASTQEHLVTMAVRTALERVRRSGGSGILDPEFPRTRFASPRYQEVCLTLALAVKLRISLPEEEMDVDLEAAAVKAVEGWISLLHRNGGMKVRPTGNPDPQTTAYGAFAVARTLIVLSDLVPTLTHDRAERALKRAAKFLVNRSVPGGLESGPLRFAALKSIAVLTENEKLRRTAEQVHQDGLNVLEKALNRSGFTEVDVSGLALALAYLTLMVREPSRREMELWIQICRRCLQSTADNGIFGGGAEASIASLPIATGFEILAQRIPEAAEIVKRLDRGWRYGFYSSLLDVDVPYLTPVSYLTGFALAERRSRGEIELQTAQPLSETGICGEGLLEIGNWTLRLGGGGSIGWMMHKSSDSTRVFGSPAGLALREGPWIIKENLLYQTSLTGAFPNRTGKPWSIEGSMMPVKIPGTERPPRKIGFPRYRGKEPKYETRLVPPLKPVSPQRGEAVPYKREISMKGGALTIETHVPGMVMHRLPVIWLGGIFGGLKVGKLDYPPEKSFEVRHVREITFEGDPWLPWTVRFDKPVAILYEPILGPVTAHPMRFLSAAAATIDIIAEDRLHMAWRVG